MFAATGVLVCIVVAILRPQWGYRWEEIERRGVDIVVAVDLSDSMMAEDVSPNRLERARRKVFDLLQILDGDRVGLVAFAGMAVIQSPLTLDYGAIQLFLNTLDTDSISKKGTSLGSAIEQATRVFDMAESSQRALLLITDGEELDEQAMGAAEEAKKRGIRIYSIGVGTEKGAPIPNREGGGFRKKPDGEIVFSKLNEERLTQLAQATGGAFVRSVSDDGDLVRIYKEEIRKDLDAKSVKSTRVKRFEERFQWPLGLAILMMAAELLLFTYNRNRRRKRATGPLVVMGLLGVACFAGIEKRAWAVPFTTQRFEGEKKYEQSKYEESAKAFEGATVANPNDAELRFNLGAAYYKNGDFAKAEEAWKSALQSTRDRKASTDQRRMQQELLYNLGNAAYRQGRLEDAVNSYRAAKEQDPSDKEAAHNLELALAELKKRKEQQQQQKQKSKEQKEEEKKQEQQQKPSEDQKEKDEKKQEDEQKPQSEKKNESSENPDSNANKQQQKDSAAKNQTSKLSRDEAERLLNSLNDEKNARKEQKRLPRDTSESFHDW
jgi:Ca-activated chloride channel family protein